jgi:hypothetical protein
MLIFTIEFVESICYRKINFTKYPASVPCTDSGADVIKFVECAKSCEKRFRCSGSSMLAFGTQGRRFEHSRSRWFHVADLRHVKIPTMAWHSALSAKLRVISRPEFPFIPVRGLSRCCRRGDASRCNWELPKLG